VLRYASQVSPSLRHFSLVLMWLLLALLPLRGWANLTMHLPVQDAPAFAPCHDLGGQAATEPSQSTTTCTLCDVCHGAMLLLGDSTAPRADRSAQALPAALPIAAQAAEPDALFRPPRR
jgi:cytochrome c553